MKVIEKVALAMLDNLEEQTDDGKPGPYVDGSSKTLNDVVVDGRIDLLRLAKAVLLAVREPSDGMVFAGKVRLVSDIMLTPDSPRKAWQAMIDAALEEGP